MIWIFVILLLSVDGAPVDPTTTMASEILPTITPAPSHIPVAGEAEIKVELSSHFGIAEKSLENIESLLLKLKEKTHKKVFGNRIFSRDSAVDSTKPVSISATQPKTKPELAPFLFEGDIFLTEKQVYSLLGHVDDDDGKSHRKYRSLSSDPDAIWDEFPIKYKFHDSLSVYAIKQIIEALNFWQNNTCIKFEHVVKKPDEDYIEFFKGQGCYSMIGKYGGRQGVSIGEGCERLGVIEHEIGHAIGLWHEQSRPDAGEYIEVEKDFILPSYTSDFQMRNLTPLKLVGLEKFAYNTPEIGTDEINTLGIPYDYGSTRENKISKFSDSIINSKIISSSLFILFFLIFSVMHYGSTAFSADGTSKTLLTLDPNYQYTIGQRERLSFYDIQVINKAYCQDKCNDADGMRKSDSARCKNGGYPHPSHCAICICPQGYGGKSCEENQQPLNAKCGAILNIKDEWQIISSPNYEEDGYTENQMCSWILKAPKKQRIEIEFIEDFSFLCATTCVDYVELKLSKDQRNTGPRFCCYHKPESSLISEGHQIAIIFRSQIGQDVGFKLQARATTKSVELKKEIAKTTTQKPTTIAGHNILSSWGSWSECSRPCGGCGIKSRVRICETAECEDKTQEFQSCNLHACPVNEDCQKILFSDRLCDKLICSQLDAVAECNQPTCCPPYSVLEGQCVSDQPLLNAVL